MEPPRKRGGSRPTKLFQMAGMAADLGYNPSLGRGLDRFFLEKNGEGLSLE